jgi:hypothetical protein
MGCNEFFPNRSVVVASEYKIIDKIFADSGMEISARFHQFPVFCSLYDI